MLRIIFVLCVLQNVADQNVSGQKLNFSVPKTFSNNIFMYYYNGPTVNDYIVLALEDGLNLTKQKDFDVNSTTNFIYHGWGENATDGSASTISSAFLQAKIRNIVAFDYSRLTQSYYLIDNYFISVYNASYIGQAIGEFFKAYVPNKQPINLIRMVSHSLGAQIMAKTARTYGIGKFPHLTGLDPAGPFYNIPDVRHLDANDGKFVDVIHTDGGFFGDGRTIGTADFFPNHGTRIQPGCPISILNPFNGCSHSRSYEYYAESIINPKAFLGKQCDRTILFSYCCCSNVTRYMGYAVNTRIHGTFWLQTNSKSPYGEGINGTNIS